MNNITSFNLLKPNTIIRGPIFPEPLQVITTVPIGDSIKLIGKGLKTNQVYEPILSKEQLGQIIITPEKEPFDGDSVKFRLGVEALRLSLAYEYDPFFLTLYSTCRPITPPA